MPTDRLMFVLRKATGDTDVDKKFAEHFPEVSPVQAIRGEHSGWISHNGGIHSIQDGHKADCHHDNDNPYQPPEYRPHLGGSHGESAYDAGLRGRDIRNVDGYENNKAIINTHKVVRFGGWGGIHHVTVPHEMTPEQHEAVSHMTVAAHASGGEMHWECAGHPGIPTDGIDGVARDVPSGHGWHSLLAHTRQEPFTKSKSLTMDDKFAKHYPEIHPLRTVAAETRGWMTSNGKVYDTDDGHIDTCAAARDSHTCDGSHASQAYDAGVRGPGIVHSDGYDINQKIINQHKLVRVSHRYGPKITVPHEMTPEQHESVRQMSEASKTRGSGFPLMQWECAGHPKAPARGDDSDGMPRDGGGGWRGVPGGKGYESLQNHLNGGAPTGPKITIGASTTVYRAPALMTKGQKKWVRINDGPFAGRPIMLEMTKRGAKFAKSEDFVGYGGKPHEPHDLEDGHSEGQAHLVIKHGWDADDFHRIGDASGGSLPEYLRRLSQAHYDEHGGSSKVEVPDQLPHDIQTMKSWGCPTYFDEVEKAVPAGDEHLRGVAAAYLGRQTVGGSHKVEPEKAKRIATAYEGLPTKQSGGAMKRSYRAFRNEVHAQFNHLTAHGYKMEPWKGDGQPYKNSSEMHADVRNNKHLHYFTGGDKHPHLDGETNEKFRAVHDVFGHAMGGHSFGPNGEESAWKEHSQMFSPTARGAMTTETRAQNSWVNFGPQAAHNRSKPSQTIFAPQKAALLPRTYWKSQGNGFGDRTYTPEEHAAIHALPHNRSDVESVKRFYNKKVTSEDHDGASRWLHGAHQTIEERSGGMGQGRQAVAEGLAAMSPRMGWGVGAFMHDKIQARNLVGDTGPVRAGLGANVRKVQRIMGGEKGVLGSSSSRTGKKVRAMANTAGNIPLGHHTDHSSCDQDQPVDIHMDRVIHYGRKPDHTLGAGLAGKRHDMHSNAIRVASSELGREPWGVQVPTWVAQRRAQTVKGNGGTKATMSIEDSAGQPNVLKYARVWPGSASKKQPMKLLMRSRRIN